MVLLNGKGLEKGERREFNISPPVEAMLMLRRADVSHINLPGLDVPLVGSGEQRTPRFQPTN